ncbi:unnamed protein product [Allacma fusca]|uniref:Cytochrome P450 n=1 Tax=Allacma fusca TaxID=39272 RepID=A0A8J2JGQ2_9HEXA|nr:unnamed protein product [Allacma fusca]
MGPYKQEFSRQASCAGSSGQDDGPGGNPPPGGKEKFYLPRVLLYRDRYCSVCGHTVKEEWKALRLYPIVPLFGRAVLHDFKLDEDSIIPKGAIVAFNTYSANRDPDNFPGPEEYRPERFSLENTLNRHPYAYIPFSAGSRNCIGQKFAMGEMKTILVNIFRNFQVQSLDTPDKVKAVAELILRGKNGIRTKFSPR